jgi:diguanylate cyclase
MGDTVLCRIADVLRAGVRSSDRVCRWGGEEFVLIAPGTTSDGVKQLTDKLRVAVPAAVQVAEVPVSVSMGVALADGERLDAQRLLFEADEALYRAKRNGRDRVEWAA